MGNSRTCKICNVDVHRASYAKHIRSIKVLENMIQGETIIHEWLFKEEQAPIKTKNKKSR